MAVPEQTPYIEHTGNGATTSFALKFQCESKDHLIVLIDDIEPPIATWSLTEGNVVFATAPAVGKKITLQRNTPFGRTTNYQSFNNSFRPQSVNGDFDRLWLKLQELGVGDWLLKLYVDRLHQQQEEKINNLKDYVDDRDDELRAYLMEEIRKQGVALDQLDDYYNYLMQRLAQIAVDKGWDASFVIDGPQTQREINLYGAKTYDMPFGGYPVGGLVRLENGDIVKSTIPNNTNDPNVDMTGWASIQKLILESIADMLAIKNPKDGIRVSVKSYNAPTNLALANAFKGGGDFIYDSSLASVNDGTLIINGWKRILSKTTVSPEDGGAFGLGDSALANEDTVGFLRAVNTGLVIKCEASSHYFINAELTRTVRGNLSIRGENIGAGSGGTTIQATSDFAGYLIKPNAGYDLRDLRLIGNNKDGCHLIGNGADDSTGLARIERVYLSDAEFGINFGDAWEHPWGLYYNQLTGVNFRTGGINLGGNTGTATSGESAWSMDNINFIGSTAAGNVGSGGIEATGTTVTHSVTSTTDKIDWTDTSTPYYGWCVLRSADGTTKFHVPPNWNSDLFTAKTFTAEKAAGETWTYKVVRMTKGLNIQRAKSVFMGVVQTEYFGIGLQLKNVPNATLNQFYSETRNRTVPLSNYCGIRLNSSRLTLCGGHAEAATYGISNFSSALNLSGSFNSVDCAIGKMQQGGSTTQQSTLVNLRAQGSTPDVIKTGGSIYDFYIIESKLYNEGMHHYLDGANSAGYHLRRRGVELGSFEVINSQAVLKANVVTATMNSKALAPLVTNNSISTSATLNAATQVLFITGLAANSMSNLNFRFSAQVRDGSSVARQLISGNLSLNVLRASSGDTTAVASISNLNKALQQGTATDPEVFVAVTGADVMVSLKINSSLTGSCVILLDYLDQLGGTVVVTQT